MKRDRRGIVSMWTVLAVFVTVVLLCAGGLPAASKAAPPADLPPRETPTPVPRSEHGAAPATAAFIELTVQPAGTGLWAVVQWQDQGGGWNDVEGWRGSVDGGYQAWGVFPADFNKGPFRWAVYAGQGGKLLNTSGAFTIPDGVGKAVKVSVTL